MNSRIEERLEKVKRTSRAARRVCFWLMVFVALVTLVTIAATLTLPDTLCQVNGAVQPCGERSPQVVVFTLVAFIGGLALTITALYRLARLFQNYSRGEIFTRNSVREIHWLGYVAFAYAIFQLLLFVAMLALRASGVVAWPVAIQTDLPIGTVLVASFILLLSWVMDVGAQIREENELTV